MISQRGGVREPFTLPTSGAGLSSRQPDDDGLSPYRVISESSARQAPTPHPVPSQADTQDVSQPGPQTTDPSFQPHFPPPPIPKTATFARPITPSAHIPNQAVTSQRTPVLTPTSYPRLTLASDRRDMLPCSVSSRGSPRPSLTQGSAFKQPAPIAHGARPPRARPRDGRSKTLIHLLTGVAWKAARREATDVTCSPTVMSSANMPTSTPPTDASPLELGRLAWVLDAPPPVHQEKATKMFARSLQGT